MARLNIILDDQLEKKFRKTVFQVKGMKKGNISEALEEAINEWIQKEKEKVKKVKGGE